MVIFGMIIQEKIIILKIKIWFYLFFNFIFKILFSWIGIPINY